jgi:hypothetical protein
MRYIGSVGAILPPLVGVLMRVHRSCKLLVLVFFGVYSISPVAYGIAAHTSPAGQTKGAHASVKSTIYLLEVLYDSLTHKDEADGRKPAKHVLVAKKKALARGRSNTVFGRRSGAVHALVPSAPDTEEYSRGEKTLPLRTRLRRTGALLPVFSGLSPPYLS